MTRERCTSGDDSATGERFADDSMPLSLSRHEQPNPMGLLAYPNLIRVR